jgi:hypothetical protein
VQAAAAALHVLRAGFVAWVPRASQAHHAQAEQHGEEGALHWVVPLRQPATPPQVRRIQRKAAAVRQVQPGRAAVDIAAEGGCGISQVVAARCAAEEPAACRRPKFPHLFARLRQVDGIAQLVEVVKHCQNRGLRQG